MSALPTSAAPAEPAAGEGRFVAWASRLQALVVLAILWPLLVVGALNLPLHPAAPLAVRVIGALILAPLVIWALVCLRLLLLREPVLELDAQGLLWRRWSAERIPWSAFARCETRRLLGVSRVTLWLQDPRQHRPGLLQALLRPGNRWLGYGDITLDAGGSNRGFDALQAALRRHLPPPPLPQDPELARRVLKARQRAARRADT